MSSKFLTAGIIAVVICGLFMPRAVQAGDWTVSPFRAPIAYAQAADNPATDSAAYTGPVKKNIGRGVMFSLVIPGAGQLYSGSWVRAIPWFAIEVAAWAAYATYHGQGRDKTDEFEAYAGERDNHNHFNYRAYLYKEWLTARDIGGDNGKYGADFAAWEALLENWDTRSGYLPTGFTHDIWDDDRQQYFEMIGKYFTQFGWGWQDTYNLGGGGDISESSWLNPGYDPNTGRQLTADDPTTTEFDGESMMFNIYADMRGDANTLLDKGNIAMEVILVNHLLSAIDAAFAVRRYNKKLTAQPSTLGDLELRYEVKYLSNDPARCLTLSIPLR
jgi:hypothetical protein